MPKKIYPSWKKALIAARRVFVYGVSAELVILLPNPELLDRIQNWESLSALLIGPVLIGGISGVVKWVRDTYGQGNYSNWVYKV